MGGSASEQVLPTLGRLSGLITLAEFPERVERLVDLAGEPRGVERNELALQGLPLGDTEHAGGEERVVRGGGGIILLVDLTADAPLGQQLPDRPEEVELQAEQAVEALQARIGGARAVAVVAPAPAPGQPVLLLDPGLIVLPVAAAPGEADPLAPTPADERLVEKLAPVVRMPLPQPEGQPLPEVMDPRPHAPVAESPEGFERDPTRGHIDADQGGEVEAGGALPAVEDHIALHRARADVLPLAEGAERDLPAEGRAGGRGAARLAAEPAAHRPEQAVERRGTGGAQGRPLRRGEPELAVALQRGHQRRQQGGQQLPARPIAHLPELGHKRGQLGPLAAGGPPAPRAVRRGATQGPDCGLSKTTRRAT